MIQPSKTVTKEIRISNFCEGKEDISVIRTKTTDDQQRWLRFLVQHAKDHLRLVSSLHLSLSLTLSFPSQYTSATVCNLIFFFPAFSLWTLVPSLASYLNYMIQYYKMKACCDVMLSTNMLFNDHSLQLI